MGPYGGSSQKTDLCWHQWGPCIEQRTSTRQSWKSGRFNWSCFTFSMQWLGLRGVYTYAGSGGAVEGCKKNTTETIECVYMCVVSGSDVMGKCLLHAGVESMTPATRVESHSLSAPYMTVWEHDTCGRGWVSLSAPYMTGWEHDTRSWGWVSLSAPYMTV